MTNLLEKGYSMKGYEIKDLDREYISQSLKFKKPIYIADTLTAIVIVTKIDLDKKRVFFRTICKVNNKIAIDGEAEIYVP